MTQKYQLVAPESNNAQIPIRALSPFFEFFQRPWVITVWLIYWHYHCNRNFLKFFDSCIHDSCFLWKFRKIENLTHGPFSRISRKIMSHGFMSHMFLRRLCCNDNDGAWVIPLWLMNLEKISKNGPRAQIDNFSYFGSSATRWSFQVIWMIAIHRPYCKLYKKHFNLGSRHLVVALESHFS